MTTLYVLEKIETGGKFSVLTPQASKEIPMESYTSRLKGFDLESMSEWTPQPKDVRATERKAFDDLKPLNRKRKENEYE